MKTTKRPRRNGLIVHPDDLEIGRFYAVYGLKDGLSETLPVSGLSFRLLAMNLPFLVGKLVNDPTHPPLTFDTRFMSFMKVTDDYVKAQQPQQAENAS